MHFDQQSYATHLFRIENALKEVAIKALKLYCKTKNDYRASKTVIQSESNALGSVDPQSRPQYLKTPHRVPAPKSTSFFKIFNLEFVLSE